MNELGAEKDGGAENHNPIGHTIQSFDVYGKELDSNANWVGAEMMLAVPPIGRFSLLVTTKAHFLNEGIDEALDTDEAVMRVLEHFPGVDLMDREPYVLNDSVLTTQVLDEKFTNRVIRQDLADSLWYHGPSDSDF